MKTSNILSAAALAALLASGCSKTGDLLQSWNLDPDAVFVEASIRRAVTRSNPLGDESAQRIFNSGDEITVIRRNEADGQDVAVAYRFDGSSWSPAGDDYLVWSGDALTFEAWYPSVGPAFVTDQSTPEALASADVMSAARTYESIPSDHRLGLDFARQRALVTVKVKGFNDEFDPATDRISDMRIYLTGDVKTADQAVTPYARDASGAGQAADTPGAVGFTYSAIGLRATGTSSGEASSADQSSPSDKNLFIEFKVGEKTLRVTGCPALEQGKSYTFNLTVGKARIEPSDVTVEEWADPVDLNAGSDGSRYDFDAEIAGEPWDGTVATAFAGGTGTETDPYLIATASQLAYLAQSVKWNTNYSGKYFKQTADIILANKPWTPIGCTYKSGFDVTSYFQGNFDGDGYKIYGLNVDKTSNSRGLDSGLFGCVSGASISNVTVIGRVDDGGFNGAGGIVGSMTNSTMTNCTAEVTVKGSGRYAGGLCGYANNISISDCTAVNCVVEGVDFVGCLVGRIAGDGSVLRNCTGSGVVKGHSYVGGIVGYLLDSPSISGCTVTADLTVTGKGCGGLAGYIENGNNGAAALTGCGFDGTITKDSDKVIDVGAAVGYDESPATFTNCWYNAAKTGNLVDNAGEIIVVGTKSGDAQSKDYSGIEPRTQKK